MAWLSRVNFIASDTLSFSDINNLGNDIRAWGGNVNGGGYTLSNVVLSASAGTMATVTGGTGAASTLTIQSTSGAGTSDAIIFKTASQSERMRIDTLGRVQIGGTSGLELANVVGSYKSYGWHNTGAAANEKYWRHQAHDSNRSLMIQALNDAYSAAATPFEIVRNSGTYTTQYVLLAQDGGNVGIGTTSPGATLPTGMTAGGKILEIGSTVDIGLCLRRTDGVVGLDIWCDGTGDSAYDTRFVNRFVNSDFKFYNGTTQQFCITYGGFVGVGAMTPRTTLSVLQSGTANTAGDTLGPAVFTGPTVGNYSGMLVVESNDAMAADKGGSIGFYGRNTSASTTSSYFASIHGRKENGTSGNQAGYLVFKVRTSGNADNEVMRIASTGNVGIGTASPAASAKLDIGGTTGALLVPRLTTTERNALTAVNGMIIYNTTDNQMQGRINGAWSAM